MQRAGPFANAVLSALQAARHLAGGLFGPERQVNFVKWPTRSAPASLSGSPRGGVVCICCSLVRGASTLTASAPCRAAPPGRPCAVGAISPFSSAAGVAGEDIRRAIFDTGRAVWTRQTEIAFIRRGLHAAIVERVTIISIVPNGQATAQALQPMHFVDSPVRCHRIC